MSVQESVLPNISTCALRQEGEANFALLADAVCIKVGVLSVYIKNTGEGVSAEIYAAGPEDKSPLAETCAFFHEADDFEEDGESQKGETLCHECGEEFFTTAARINHHALDEGDGIDHEADADHVAINPRGFQ